MTMLRTEHGHKRARRIAGEARGAHGAEAASRGAGLRERNKERKREALVRAGRALFAQRGFEETTTRAIAARAGVASGTFFLYFGEKRDLLFHIFREDMTAVLEEAIASEPRDAPLVRRLAHVFGRYYARYARSPRLSRVFLKELLFLEEGANHAMMAYTMAFVLRLAEMVSAARVRGEIRASVDPMQAASLAMALYVFDLVGMFNGVTPTPELTVAQLEGQLELLMNGLARSKRA